MSTTTSGINAKQSLVDFIRTAGTFYEKDLNHIPADKLTETPMGCARTVQDFTAEVISFNHYCAKAIAGQAVESRTPEERAAFTASIDTVGEAMNGIRASCEALADAVADLSDDELGADVSAPWGEQTTKYHLAQMAASHVMYHDGQLNYIQSCYGDAESHWH